MGRGPDYEGGHVSRLASSPWGRDVGRCWTETRQARSRKDLEREAEDRKSVHCGQRGKRRRAWRTWGVQGAAQARNSEGLHCSQRGGHWCLSAGWSPQALREPREEEARLECGNVREGGCRGEQLEGAWEGGMTLGGADPSRREDKWDDNTQVQQTGPLKTMSGCGVGTRFWWAEGEKGVKKGKTIRPCFFQSLEINGRKGKKLLQDGRDGSMSSPSRAKNPGRGGSR